MASESDLPADRDAAMAEAEGLIDALLNGRSSDADLARLERLAVSHPPVAAEYLMAVHLDGIVAVALGQPDDGGLGSEWDAAAGGPACSMDEAMILPAIREGDTARTGPPASAAVVGVPPSPRPPRRWWPSVAAASLAIAGLGILGWLVRPRPPCAVITATAEATPGTVATPGAALQKGRSVRIGTGAVELTFARGAVVIVRGPAEFRVAGDNTLDLVSGAVSAHVPGAARGFSVLGPGLRVVDLGTDFGLRTLEGGAAAEVYVVNGLVDASAVDAGGHDLAGPVHLRAGQAVRHAQAAGSTPFVTVYSTDGFDRDIAAVRLPVQTHGTGAQLAVGSTDPYWQFTSVPGPGPGPGGKAAGGQPAVVIDLSNRPYVVNSPDAAWVSTVATVGNAPAGRYVLHTTLDLSGFEPSSVIAKARVAVDDQVADILVNGTSCGVSTPMHASTNTLSDLTLTAAWRSGVNDVDVLLDNGANPDVNVVGLQLTWDVSGCPLIRRR